MNILQSIRQKLAFRLQFLKRKKARQNHINAIIEKYKLNDADEQKKIIDKYTLMQTNKRAFGRKAQAKIKDKISLMVHCGLIKIIE